MRIVDSPSSISISISISDLQLPENLDPLLNRFLHLLPSSTFRTSKNQLSNIPPLTGQIPLLRNTGVNKRAIVLQVCAEAERFKTSPD